MSGGGLYDPSAFEVFIGGERFADVSSISYSDTLDTADFYMARTAGGTWRRMRTRPSRAELNRAKATRRQRARKG